MNDIPDSRLMALQWNKLKKASKLKKGTKEFEKLEKESWEITLELGKRKLVGVTNSSDESKQAR